MKTILTTLSCLVLVGCASLGRSTYRPAQIHLGHEYRGAGIYLFDVTNNAFRVRSGISTSLVVTVPVGNGHENAVLLNVEPDRLFGDPCIEYYDRDDRFLGSTVAAQVFAPDWNDRHVLLKGYGQHFCGCNVTPLAASWPLRYSTEEAEPWPDDDFPLEIEVETGTTNIPANTARMEIRIPMHIQYYIVGDRHHYAGTQDLTIEAFRGQRRHLHATSKGRCRRRPSLAREVTTLAE